MWGSPLFALRRALLGAGSWLGSWRLSVALLVLLATFHGLLAIWATSSAPAVVRGIGGLAPFWLVTLFLLVNTAACFWRRLPRLKRELAAAPQATGDPDWELTLPGTDLPGARRRLEHGGYRGAAAGSESWSGVRRRWAPLGGFLFHGAFFVLAAGFVLSLLTRAEIRVRLADGEVLGDDPTQVVSRSPPPRLLPAPRLPHFGLEDVHATFWQDRLHFTGLEATLALPSGRRARTRINSPVWLGGATFARLTSYGWAPRWELRDPAGRVIDSAFVKLAVFPPGQQDWFRLPGLPHRVTVEVLPDHAVEDGRAVTRSLNLVDPAVLVHAFRNRLDLGGGLLTPADSFDLEGLQLAFPEIRPWGEVAVVRDPGLLVVLLGLVLALAGLLLRVGDGRGEVRCEAGPDGVRVRGWGGRPPAGLGDAW